MKNPRRIQLKGARKSVSPSVRRRPPAPSPLTQTVTEAPAGVVAVDAYQDCECGCVHCAACGVESGAEMDRADEAVLERSLEALSVDDDGRVLIGARAEPYPRRETQLGATRAILQKLIRHSGFFISLYTRSPLALRDAELFREAAARHCFQLHVCLPSCCQSLVATLEPNAAAVHTRLAMLRRLAALRVAAGLRIAPAAPGLNDSLSSLETLVRQASEHGARFVSWDVLRLTESNRERFFNYLAETQPHLLERHRRIYAQRFRPSVEYQRLVATRLNALKRKYGITGDGTTASPRRSMKPVQLAMPMAS